MTGLAIADSGMVSVIIPVFNRPKVLREAVDSVLAQTYRPFEIIIVDDGSTDGTATACLELARSEPGVVRTVRQDHGGPGRARENGRQLSRGEFIQYLDSDDVLFPRKFEVQVRALRANPGCGVAYGFTRYRRKGEDAATHPHKGSGRVVETMFPSFLSERWWDTPTPLYRTSVCDAAGPWTTLQVEEDWEYDCRIAALGTRLIQCREFVAEVRDGADDQLSGKSLFDKSLMRQRAEAHRLICLHARHAGIRPEDPHMQRFARELFLLSRQCGSVGLGEVSRSMFDLAREVSAKRSRGTDFLLYRAAAACVGWEMTGRVACWADRWR